MSLQKNYPFYIRLLNVELMNMLYATAETKGVVDYIETRRREGYYEIWVSDETVWRDLFLYGQMVAQTQDAFIEAGEYSEE